ncbi:MAG: hypothetical protein HRU38_13105 [Saccharospirillaceae bacterium]|nr:hypothetical protein [Pseudomonadales bacterium]NRB79582.1 hypothetical protein [Saccharospirillaceae bacterium]
MKLFTMNLILTKLSVMSVICIWPTIVLANHNESNSTVSNKPTLTITHDSKHTYTSNNSSTTNNTYNSNTSTSSNNTVTVSHSNSHSHHSGHHTVGEDLFYIFLEVFDEALFFGGISSMERVDGSDNLGLRPRVDGELLLPFFKFDVSALSGMSENGMGSDMSFEMGYGPWAMHYRNTSFLNDNTFSKVQSFNKFEFLYRMSFGSDFELDLGLGSYQVDDQMQFVMSLPIKMAFTPHNIIEFRPSWSQDIQDYDLAFYSGTEFYSFKVGYRYISQSQPFSATPIKAYSNIYAGFSAHY